MLIGGHTGSTHTGLMLAELTDGWVDAHVHSRETTFYVLSGDARRCISTASASA